VPSAGSCADCPKRTGHNKLLFSTTLESRVIGALTQMLPVETRAHVAKTVAAKPELVQISTAYGTQKEGSPVLPRNKYTAIRDDKPKSNDEAKRPEFKYASSPPMPSSPRQRDCTFTSLRKPGLPVHHPKKSHGASTSDARFKTEQEERRKEEASPMQPACVFSLPSAQQSPCGC